MHTGFTILYGAREIETSIYLPGNSQVPPFVTFARQDSSVSLFLGHMYYRHELLPQLETTLPGDVREDAASNAAALVLSLYCLHGSSALERLEGDFSLVIWDAKRRCFVGMRDPLGGYPLFWTEQTGTPAFSTSIWALLRLTKQYTLNMEYFADFLTRPATRSEGTGEDCAYTGIHRVLPGTIVTLQPEPLSTETRTYWHWLENSRDPGTDSIEEIADHYRSLFHTAVRERLNGLTLADLSGGMDSTSTALIAQEEIAAGTGKPPLHTFSLVYDRLPILAQERAYIEEVIEHEPRIVAHLVSGDNLLEFDCFGDPPPHEEPYTALGSVAMDCAAVDIAMHIGASTILTGFGADEVHDVLPFYLTDMLRRGQFRKAWREACQWASALKCNPWNVLSPFGFANLAPSWFIKSTAHLQSWRSLRLNQQKDWTVPPWILPDFVHRYSLRDRAIDHTYAWHHLSHDVASAMILASIQSLFGDFLRWSVTAPRGIMYAHPFYDLRLLCFGIGMARRLQPQPGQMKPVLAETMRHKLPEKILKRRQKSHFNEVYYFGLARNFQHLENLVRQAPLERLPIFGKEILLSYLREARFSDAGVRQLERLNSTLSLLLWLSHEQEWRKQAPVPSQIIRISSDE